jgi:DNA-binding MarR family transcriptional regulator
MTGRTAMADLLELFTDLVRVETRLYNGIDARLRDEHDVSLGQCEIMRIIAGRDTCRVYDIAHELGITVGATSKAVDRLEAAGRCRRLANPEDRRSSLLQLTAAGRRVLSAAIPTLEREVRAHVADVLPARDVDRLATALSTLHRHLRTDS